LKKRESAFLQSAIRNMLASANQTSQRYTPEGRPVLVWLIAATLVLLFVSLIVVAPFALAHGYNSSAFVLYQMFGRVCHRIQERAFQIEGHPFAVCARCAGIYFGFAAGFLIYPLLRSLRRGDTPARKWLLLASLPLLMDFTLGYFRVWENTHLSRSLTGGILGAVAAFYVVPGLMDLSRMSLNRQNGYSHTTARSSSFEGVMSNE
jgi:uncharacterized membrane protein